MSHVGKLSEFCSLRRSNCRCLIGANISDNAEFHEVVNSQILAEVELSQICDEVNYKRYL